MIEVKNLVKNYGDKRALNNISFTVGEDEILGFLGPNGAGKSTTMNILTGYISMTSGEVKIGGIDILKDPIGAKRLIGYLPEQPPLYPEMTVTEYLDFVCELKGVKDRAEQVKAIAAKTGVGNVLERRIGNLSKGYRQRVGLAAALAGDPKVLILDEPTVGLDPGQIVEIRSLIRSLGKAHTVILSSHILSEISAVCDRVLIINDGKIAAEDTPENIKRSVFGSDLRILIRADGTDDEIRAVLDKLSEDLTYEKRKDTDEYELAFGNRESREISRKLFFAFANANLPILMQREEEITLEDVFMKITANSRNSEITSSAGKEGKIE
ncbi:MAG TPA: ATP-binding cassette domain-containing protein [Candidatus Ornithomonoglobus merdipullorum]|uniref:ATP-binding cassette domain-containing protein n=1 Tax=Candidatus Ornithomonoglobus merdipullorum TaxID=2840895 RepID=A0A9D1M9U0_9FIRM|nr:ATP-binding cassette domain-containing protein [Candidatus Ornithomonoglobus merdipullorum]